MFVALGVDAKQLAIFSRRAQKKEMKGAEFSVHEIQSNREGNQTPPTNSNHAILTQWWLACRWLGLITTYSH